MAITQEQADKFCLSLKSFHDSLPEDEKYVLEQILDQAAMSEKGQGKEPKGRPFFERFLTLNVGPSSEEGPFVTLKFPSDNDEPGDAY